MQSLRASLKQYEIEHPKRSTGGLYSLSGFDFQLRVYLADLVESLSNEQSTPLMEAFSDITAETDSGIVITQVKRTLSRKSLREAADEIAVIDEFLQTRQPDLRDSIRFQVVGAGKNKELAILSEDTWDSVEVPVNARRRDDKNLRLREIHQQRRLLAPILKPDPWQRLIKAIFHRLHNPFTFADMALQLCLNRGTEPSGASPLAEQIARLYAEHRDARQPELLGRFLSESDFITVPDARRGTLLGQIPGLSDLQKQRFMSRPDRVQVVMARIDQLLADRAAADESRVPTLWINGSSGTGKSILLLQVMQEVVRQNYGDVLWLSEDSGQFFLLLQDFIFSQEAALANDLFVFIDDFYGPNKRQDVKLASIRQLVQLNSGRRWPILVTCGPREQYLDFRQASELNDFAVHDWTLTPATSIEKSNLVTWFAEKTGKPIRAANAGPAFAQSQPLMLSMMAELKEGSLTEFANRFKLRFDQEGITEAMVAPLALNRLYVWPPRTWLTREQDDALRRISQDEDFEMIGGDLRRSRYFRLTHPHISDAIYFAVRNRSDDIGHARDLGSAFRRSLETDAEIAMLVLERAAEGYERLNICNTEELEEQFALAWRESENRHAVDLPRAWTSWAVWHSRSSRIHRLLDIQAPPLEMARDLLDLTALGYGSFWLRLWRFYPGHRGLFADGWSWLKSRLSQSAPEWSLAWEAVESEVRSSDMQNDWEDLGSRWLGDHQFIPQWNYVFRRLTRSNPLKAPWLAARSLIAERPDNRNWPFVFEILYDCRENPHSGVDALQLQELGVKWLDGREDNDSWSYVWQKLFENDSGGNIRKQGIKWLDGREDHHGWSYVWEKLIPACVDKAERENLLALGMKWLDGREDHDSWRYVWWRLVENNYGENLRKWGMKSLDGREEHQGWSYVRQKLISDSVDEIEHEYLLTQGTKWLDGREELDGWSYVWEKLAIIATSTRVGFDRSVHLALGWIWLNANLEKKCSNWGFVWQVLADNDFSPSGATLSLEALCWEWLRRTENRDSGGWGFLYEYCLKHGFDDLAFLTAGFEWVVSHKNLPQTPGIAATVWSVSLKRGISPPEPFVQTTKQIWSLLTERADSCEDWVTICIYHSDLSDHAMAATSAQKAVEIDSESVTAWRILMFNLAELPGKEEEARRARTKFRELCRTAEDWAALAFAHKQAGCSEEAVEAAGKAVSIDGSYIAAWRTLMFSLPELPGKEEETQQTRTRFRELCRTPEDWSALGSAYGQARCNEEAVEAARTAISIDGSHVAAWRILMFSLPELPGKEEEARQARTQFRELCRTADNWSRLGIAYRQAGCNEEAIEAARKSLSIDGNHLAAWRTLMFSLPELPGKEEEARQAQTKFRELCRTAEDWSALGIAYGQAGCFEEAVEAARKALSIDGNHLAAWRTLMFCLPELPGKEEEARQAQAKFSELCRTAEDWTLLGRAYGQSGCNEEAVEAAGKAISIDGSHVAAWRTLIFSLPNLPGKEKEAQQARTKLRELCRTANDWSALGIAYGLAGCNEEAIEAARKAISVDSSHVAAWRTCARCEDQLGRSEQALFALKQLSKLTGEKEEPSYSVNAKEAYEAVLAEPESAESWKNLALAYRLASRAVEAISVARNAVGSSSKVAPYTIGLVEELLNSEPQAVVGYLEYLLILFGPTAIYLHLLGAARLKTPDIPEAVDAHRAACSLDDSNQYYWYALGKALERQGDLAGAQIAYEKALRLKPHYQKAHRALDKLISRIEDLTD